MKKVILLLFFLFLIQISALASASIYCDCGQSPCSCFIQEGDNGLFVKKIIQRLRIRGYYHQVQRVSVYDADVVEAVIRFQADHCLPLTGTMDDETLTLLIHGKLPEQMAEAFPFYNYSCEWVPTDGGFKRHCNPDCHNSVFTIYHPRKVSVRNAEAMGYAPCKICHKPSKGK